jgi:hypothetical protein
MRENQIYILPRVVRPDVQNNLCTLRTCGNKWSTDTTQGIELGHSQWVGGGTNITLSTEETSEADSLPPLPGLLVVPAVGNLSDN